MDERQELKTKFKKTKYCKIYASKRCKKWDFFLKVTAFTYNLALCIISFLAIILHNDILGIISAFLTLVVFATTLFITNLHYGEKVREYNQSVSELNKIIARLDTEEDVKSINKDYDFLMDSCIAHEDIDYVCYKYDFPADFSPNNNDESNKTGISDIYKDELKKNRRDYYIYQLVIFILKTIVTLGLYILFFVSSLLVSLVREIVFKIRRS